MNPIERTGLATLLGRLAEMGRSGVRAVRSAVRKGQNVLDLGIASVALKASGPRVVNGHTISPGGLGSSIGSTMGRTRSDGSFEAKTGLAVGKSQANLDEQVTRGKKSVAYGHWGVLGTQTRATGAKTRKNKSGKVYRKVTGNAVMNRGRMLPTPFVVSGAQASKPAAEAAMVGELEAQVKKNWNGGA